MDLEAKGQGEHHALRNAAEEVTYSQGMRLHRWAIHSFCGVALLILVSQVAVGRASHDTADMEAFFSKADEAKRHRDWPHVVEIAESILARDPKAGRAWYRLGGAKENLNDFKGAEAAFRKASSLHYFEKECLLESALLAARQDNQRAALEYLMTLARIGFDQPGQIEGAPEFVPLKSDARFQATLLKVRKNARWQAANPQWSKDGKQIVFERGSSAFPPKDSQIYAIDADGSHTTQLTFGLGNHMMPDFSPDNRLIVYSSGEDGKRKLHIEDLQSHHVRVLVKEMIGNEHFPSWSPDGTQITFNADGNGHRQIFVVNVDGSGLKALTAAEYNSDYPRWTASGNTISFESDRAGMWDTYLMDGDGNAQTRLVWASTPNLSSDKSKIVFGNNLLAGNGEIYTIHSDGTNLQRITRSRTENWEPAWSPDGNRIVFMSQRTGHFELFLMNADGSSIHRLTKTHQPAN